MNNNSFDDTNNLSSRLKRYGSVSLGVGEVAAKVMWQRLFNTNDGDLPQAKIITEVLGNLKGPAMKIAQMLATIPDAIPAEYVQEFLSLQADAPAMGWPFVRRRMQSELGPDWQQRFKSFEQLAMAAASLGQVHKAVSLEGQDLACKLQYPNMAAIMDADLNQLKGLLSIYKVSSGAIDTDNIFQEIKQRLSEELSYLAEADNIDHYRRIFALDTSSAPTHNDGFSNQVFTNFTLYNAHNPLIHIPQVDRRLTTEHLLTMQFLPGTRIKDAQDRPVEFRHQLARNLFVSWYYPLYHFGVVHGDPHLGNYTINQDASINLYDFGCIRYFDHQFVQGIFELYQGLRHNRQDQIVHAYELWGFTNLNFELLETLNLWARLFYDPILDDCIRPLQADNRGHHGRNVAATVYQKLQSLGGVRPPREFVFMDRATVGIGSACMQVKAELNWHQLFCDIVKGSSFEKYLT